MSRRSRIVGFGSAGVLVLAGIACAVVFSGGLGQNLAFVLVALGLVLATALVFYEVGLTEDRNAHARSKRPPARGRAARARGRRKARASAGAAEPDQARSAARPAAAPPMS